MKLGYACINISMGKEGKFKTMTVKKALTLNKDELINKIKGLIIDNLYTTYKILQWNKEHKIYLYRMTSNMIPLATHELLKSWEWWNDKDILRLCNKIKNYTIANNIQVSFHPDQFCVINSPKENVFQMAQDIINYHNKLANLLNCNILVLHVGGVYGNKQIAIQRFIDNFKKLPIDIQNKIIIENDDKSFTVEDVLYICKKLNIKMCIDFHHDKCNSSSKSIEYYISDIINTWKGNTPKCHISSGRDMKYDKKHADYIDKQDFNNILNITKNRFDMVIEAKAKDLAVLKLINNE